MISDKKYYSIYWRSLALNLRWSFAAIRWLKRFETDFSVIPPRKPNDVALRGINFSKRE